MPAKTLILANLLALVAVLVVNYLANALPVAGRTPAEVSALYPTLFTPAGFTFSIWGVIYLLLLGFALYAFRFWNKGMPDYLQKIGWLFVLSCAANAGWLFAFHYLYIGLSMLVMLLLLGSLIMIYLNLGIGTTAVSPAENWFVHIPFSVYLGWVTVATIANASIFLTHIGWNGEPGGPELWTSLIIAAAAGIALWALISDNNIAYASVVLWALFGILSKRQADMQTEDKFVETAAIIGMVLVVLGIAYTAFLKIKQAMA